MTLYNESLAREHEILSHEIDRIIEGFPNTNDDQMDDPSFAAFKNYHDLRLKRLDLEAEQSCYFVDEKKKSLLRLVFDHYVRIPSSECDQSNV